MITLYVLFIGLVALHPLPLNPNESLVLLPKALDTGATFTRFGSGVRGTELRAPDHKLQFCFTNRDHEWVCEDLNEDLVFGIARQDDAQTIFGAEEMIDLSDLAPGNPLDDSCLTIATDECSTKAVRIRLVGGFVQAGNLTLRFGDTASDPTRLAFSRDPTLKTEQFGAAIFRSTIGKPAFLATAFPSPLDGSPKFGTSGLLYETKISVNQTAMYAKGFSMFVNGIEHQISTIDDCTWLDGIGGKCAFIRIQNITDHFFEKPSDTSGSFAGDIDTHFLHFYQLLSKAPMDSVTIPYVASMPQTPPGSGEAPSVRCPHASVVPCSTSKCKPLIN